MSGATPRAVGWASAGLLAGAAMALLGVLAILVRAPLLFPAIGASAAVVALAPLSRGSQPRSRSALAPW